MRRAEYLDLMKKESIHPNTVTVSYRGVNYDPIAYQLSFRNDGSVRHTAVLRSRQTNYAVYCRLQDVKLGLPGEEGYV